MAISQQLHTLEDFEVFIAQPENAERRFELIHGEIVEKVPTEEHSLLIGNLYLFLRLYNDAHDLGRVAFEVRRKVPGDDHNARLPDLEFTSKARLLPVVREGAVPQMPDLAVEVKSPDDTYIELREKALYYLKNGAKLVWLLFPERRQIEIHTAESIKTLSIDDYLDGGDVLPGFRVAVRDIFNI